MHASIYNIYGIQENYINLRLLHLN